MKRIIAITTILLTLLTLLNITANAAVNTYNVNEINKQGFMLLVNRSNRLPSGYKAQDLINASGHVDVRFSNLYLNKTVLEHMKTMFEAAEKDGINLYIYSAYRTEYEQTYAFNNKVNSYRSLYGSNAEREAAKIVAIPNTSEHQTGLAADIVSTEYRVRDGGFANSNSGKWLSANSWRYGFILRYQADKTDITKIIFEPWHFRYVGKEAAKFMYKNNLCFEEYHKLLAATPKPTASPRPTQASTLASTASPNPALARTTASPNPTEGDAIAADSSGVVKPEEGFFSRIFSFFSSLFSQLFS